MNTEIALRDKRHLLTDIAVQPPKEAQYGYESALWATGVKVLAFAEFGSYQGNWWAHVEFPNGERYFIEGSYGSCSGCDSFQAEFSDWNAVEKPDYLHRLRDFGLDYLMDCMTQEQAQVEAARNIDWDLEAQQMVDWVKEEGDKWK